MIKKAQNVLNSDVIQHALYSNSYVYGRES